MTEHSHQDLALAIPLELERAAANGESLEIPCSFASDAIIDDPFLGPVQLSMDASAVDLSEASARVASGAVGTTPAWRPISQTPLSTGIPRAMNFHIAGRRVHRACA